MVTEYTKKDKEKYLEVLEECNGFVSVAAKKFGCALSTIHYWRKKDPWFHQEVVRVTREARERKGDFTEKMLFKNISSGKEQSIFFYLKNQCADRGYDKEQYHMIQQAPTEIIIRTAEDIEISEDDKKIKKKRFTQAYDYDDKETKELKQKILEKEYAEAEE